MDIPITLTALTLLPLLSGIGVVLGTAARTRRGGPHGLLFHSVGTTPPAAGLSYCSESVFAAVMERFAQAGLKTSTIREMVGPAASSSADADALYITFDDGFEDFHTKALPVLEKHRIRATIFPVAGCLGARSTWDVFSPRRHLSAAQLQEIASLGHEIGSHTTTHPDLTLLSPRQRRSELLDSRKRIEDLIGTPVTSISFPFGSWNRAVWETAQECGYKAAAAYRGHRRLTSGIVPVHGVYAFDTPDDIAAKANGLASPSNAAARAALMPHFAKGSPLWRFRADYSLLNRRSTLTDG